MLDILALTDPGILLKPCALLVQAHRLLSGRLKAVLIAK